MKHLYHVLAAIMLAITAHSSARSQIIDCEPGPFAVPFNPGTSDVTGQERELLSRIWEMFSPDSPCAASYIVLFAQLGPDDVDGVEELNVERANSVRSLLIEWGARPQNVIIESRPPDSRSPLEPVIGMVTIYRFGLAHPERLSQ